MPSAIKSKKVTFKHVESEWYNYHQTLKEIVRLREEIMNPFEDEPDTNIGGGVSNVRTPGDPTGQIATRLTTSKQSRYLTEIVEAIEQVYNALPDNYKELVRIKYWNKNKLTWDTISREMHVNRATAMRWRDDIIQATVELLGWR